MDEADILQFICANQGAVNTDYLVCNLGSGTLESLLDVIRNQDKFVSCCPFGQPKVVARTRLRLCTARSCQGSCSGLHLCKNFLLSGSCHFTQSRRGCCFSHEVDSFHNLTLLRDHGLEGLTRTELCTLLLQSDTRLLPPICFDYNNGAGEVSRCKDGSDCKRLHICEKYLNRDCSCFRSHDFSAPQPLKLLQDKSVPAELIRSLKTVYANIRALRYAEMAGKGNQQSSSATNNTDESGDDGLNPKHKEWRRGRGHRGNRGNRGNRGSRGNRGQRQSSDNLFYPSHGNSDPQPPLSFFDDTFTAANPSEDGQTDIWMDIAPDKGGNGELQQPNQDPGNLTTSSTGVRGRGGTHSNRGNHQPPQWNRSTSDILAAVNDDGNNDAANRRERQKPARDKTEICMYFIKGRCIHEDRCFKAHDRMPYRWQVRENDQWTNMAKNETIEKDYCDPNKTYSSSSSPPVHFDTMTFGLNKVRRLSTMNSLLESNFIHTTEWVWYWEDEFGKWNTYASADGGHKAADMDSSTLEQKFLDNDKDVVEFIAGSHSYSLSFQDMIQTNKQYGTKRVVRRRPQFVSAADVQAKRARKPLGQAHFAAIPDHWDKKQIPETGYKRVPLQRTSAEFKEIEELFCQTMKGFDIVTVERIQNKTLWESFQLKKTQMKSTRSGRDVAEKKLFHGTDNKFVDDISLSNFDWRLCGTHGTAFGKGSYFARDAKYSDSYTSDSNVKSMFIARLLVGDYTKGSPEHLRPPSKDGREINKFDSCVDNVANPSIYVLFEMSQIYPEYLLQYKTRHPLVDMYGAAPVVAPKPAPKLAPQPSVSVYKPTTPSYQPSTSSYQLSTSSYHASTSSYQPSTSSYPARASSSLSTTSVSKPTAPPYQPSTSSYQRNTISHPAWASSSLSSAGSFTQFSPPTIPPAKKKSDTNCVIA